MGEVELYRRLFPEDAQASKPGRSLQDSAYLQKELKKNPTGAHFQLTGGEVIEVNFVGITMPLVEPETGKISQAPASLATLPASNHIYAEMQLSQDKAISSTAMCCALFSAEFPNSFVRSATR